MRQVHLWDYTRVDADREFLKTLAAPGVKIIDPPESDKTAKFPNRWKGYYAYYSKALQDDDWLIKCDDDVVFIANLGGEAALACYF